MMQRLKALYRARAIHTPGQRVYGPQEREAWMARLTDRGARFRAEIFHAQLDALRALRPRAKAAMLAEARRDPVGPILGSIPGLGPVRVALILATMKTPWRFRSKRNLWAYAGFGIVTRTSAEHRLIDGRPVRRPRAPLTRGLNPNHNPVLKDVFKGAATTAPSRPGPLRAFYEGPVARGMRPSMARLTVARKLAALTLRPLEERRTLRSDEADDAASLTRREPRGRRWGIVLPPHLPLPGRGCEGLSHGGVRPAASRPRHTANHRHPRRTRRSVRPALRGRVSDRTMVRPARPARLPTSLNGSGA